MSKHTPGPWKAKADHPDKAIGITLEDGLLVAIARYSDNPRITQGDAEANARLIAAAPEMLEALKDIATFPGSYDRERLKAAIAKAEDRS